MLRSFRPGAFSHESSFLVFVFVCFDFQSVLLFAFLLYLFYLYPILF